MTAAGFRKMCLGLRGVEEGSHMGHPDFRVGGRIFATLWQDRKWGMVRLTLEQREVYMRAEPAVFRPVKGGWGARGATEVRLGEAKTKGQHGAVLAAMDVGCQNFTLNSP